MFALNSKYSFFKESTKGESRVPPPGQRRPADGFYRSGRLARHQEPSNRRGAELPCAVPVSGRRRLQGRVVSQRWRAQQAVAGAASVDSAEHPGA